MQLLDRLVPEKNEPPDRKLALLYIVRAARLGCLARANDLAPSNIAI